MSSRRQPLSYRPRGGEAGFAVPTVTLMLLAAMAIAGVAVTASIGGQSGAVRDQNTKSALQLAEAGVEQALYQYNDYGRVKRGVSPCAPLGAGEPDAGGWCPEVTATVNGTPVDYLVRPTSTEMPSGDTAWTEMEVVSIATLAGVRRRVDVVATSSAGQRIFHNATVQSREGITIRSNAEIHAGTATDGDLVLEENAKQCGTATVGVGKELEGEGYFSDTECTISGGTAGEEEIDLPPVEQGEAPIENDNDRLFTQDHISGNKNTACFNGYNGAGRADKSCGGRELVIGSNSAVTLGGSVYSLCRLTLNSNSSLYIAPGAEVLIYFDSPEACGYSEEPVTQLELRSNSRITSASGRSGSVALLFVGSKTISTQILLSSETSVEDPVLCSQNFVIYAPETDIVLDSNTSYCGAMAGKTVTMRSNSEFWTSSGVSEWYLPLTSPHYEPSRFVDCAATVGVEYPDEGC